MKKLVILASLSLGLGAANAQIYGELAYGANQTKNNTGGSTFKSSPSGLRATLGYEIEKNFSVEALISLAQDTADIKQDGQTQQGLRTKIDSLYGLYLKPKYSLASDVEVFARLGYAHAKNKNTGFAPASESHSSISYGVGLSYALTPSVYLSADYMQYIRKTDLKGSGYTLGLGYRF